MQIHHCQTCWIASDGYEEPSKQVMVSADYEDPEITETCFGGSI